MLLPFLQVNIGSTKGSCQDKQVSPGRDHGKRGKILRVKEGREHGFALWPLDLRPVFGPLDGGGEIGS